MLFTLCEEKHSFFLKYQISSILHAVFNMSRILISVIFFTTQDQQKTGGKDCFIGKERVE